MNIHEYQAKELLRVVRRRRCPRASSPRRPPRPSRRRASLGAPVVVVKAQMHAGGRGKGGGVKVAKSPAEAKQVGERDPRHDAVTHADRARGQARAQGLRRGGLRRSRASSTSRSLLDRATEKFAVIASTEGGMDIEEVAAQHAREDPHACTSTRRSASSPSRCGSSASALGLAGDAGRAARGVPRRALPALRREGRLAGRDQPAGRHEGRRAARARRQAQLRRQRALPAPGHRASCATPTRRTRASARRRRSTSPTSGSTATSAAW